MGRVDGKVALITGGASGIGRAACQTLSREAARVVIADINGAGAEETLASLDGDGFVQMLDVSNEAHWADAVAEAINRYGRLDIVVNSAGIGINGDFEETTLEDWNRVMAINLTGTFLGCKHGIKGIKQNGEGGSVINISSIMGVIGGDDIAAYSASKGGVTILTKSVALHCAKHQLNIRCNAVLPTYVDSEMLDPVAEQLGGRDIMVESMASLVPVGRMAVPQDIANAVLFLASDESSMVTGSSLVVDGATTAGLPGRHASA